MTKTLSCVLAVLLIAVVTPAASAQKAAKENAAEKRDGPSNHSVEFLASYAWANIPDEVSKPDGTRIKVRGVPIDKFMLSMEDTRRIVVIAERSAQARICGLTDLERVNHDKMMKNEEASKRWSNEQLAWIHWLHDVIVKVRAFDPETASKRAKDMKLDKEAEKKTLTQVKKLKKPSCSEKRRQQVKQEIEEFVNAPS